MALNQDRDLNFMEWEEYSKQIQKLFQQEKVAKINKRKPVLSENNRITGVNYSLEELIKFRHNIKDSYYDVDFFSDPQVTSNNPETKHLKHLRKHGAERKLDLHGYTIDKAVELFEEFIKDSYLKKIKYLLVVTGKGREERPDSIKKTILERLKKNYYGKIIQSFNISSIKDGGDGAIYIILRNLR